MNKYVLYYSQYCYFCQKVLMFLHGKESSIELRSTADSDNQQALQKGGGKGQVPCLCIVDTSKNAMQWLYESDDIVAYIKQNQLAK